MLLKCRKIIFVGCLILLFLYAFACCGNCNGNRSSKGTTFDTVSPVVESTSPVNNATNVPVNTEIIAIFSEPMDSSTITIASFYVTSSQSPVTGMVTYNGTTATFTPSANLANNTQYTATITTGAKDLAGNPITVDYTWSFTTRQATTDTTAPTVLSTSPANNANNVAINSAITATFSEPMDSSTITIASFQVTRPTEVGAPQSSVTGTVTYSGTTATFTPSTNLAYGTKYTATITTGAKDSAGNSMEANYVWQFTTGAASDNTSPIVNITSPADGSTVKGELIIQGTASDDTGISKVFVSVNSGTPNIAAGTTEWTYLVPITASGIYTILVTAEDISGNKSIPDSITVTVSPGWYSLAEVTQDEVTSAAIASDGNNVAVFYSHPVYSSNLDEGIIKKWDGNNWTTLSKPTNECHSPDIAVDGTNIIASWSDDGDDLGFATNVNGPFVSSSITMLVKQFGMTVAFAKGRAYITFAARYSNGKASSYSMLHVRSPIGTTGDQLELKGGWNLVNTDVGLTPSITGDAYSWYAASTQGGYLFVQRDYNLLGDGFRMYNPPSDPEIVLFSGKPVVTWIENSSKEVYVASWNGTKWSILGNSTTTGYIDSLRIAASKTDIWIIYKDTANSSQISILKYDGLLWTDVSDNLNSFAGDVSWTDIAIYNEQAIISFVKDGKLNVMKYLP